MDIDHLRALVSSDFEAVNTLITEKIQSDIPLLDDLANHIVSSGGKRIRPLIVLLASHACHYQGKNHIQLAAMMEFFHTATLLHDDVIDESALRRGRETANKIWGSKASILVGDYLFTQYVQLIINVGDLRIMQLLTDISLQIGCGELQQLNNRHTTEPSADDYFNIIRAKTSLLFAASASMGAMVAKTNQDIEKGLYDYGLHLGNAFQLIDDALDYCSDAKTIGKNIGDDLADGKATLPLLYVLEQGNPTQKSLIKESLKKGTLDYLPEILEAIKQTNAIEYTKNMATQEMNLAISALNVLSDSPYKEALIILAQYAVHRQH